jgi:hypothetical protein
MSNLLSQASLVMIPSGYKEDVVYSAVPTNGSGDLSFTRASNGTRVNSAGLVEVCPWNFVEQSSNLGSWPNDNVTITTGITDAFGTTNAVTMSNISSGNNTDYIAEFSNPMDLPSGTVINTSVYLKGSGTIGVAIERGNTGDYFFTSQIFTLTNAWVRYDFAYTMPSGTRNGIHFYVTNLSGTTATSVDICFPQINYGLTAKPYFPTTDRLNVPRLTYQNGGGGCPSLLLEKQSTNVLTYSEDFSNAAWVKNGSTVTANNAISPDGTQNADKIVFSGADYDISQSVVVSNNTLSIYVKGTANETILIGFGGPGATGVITHTLTGNWDRVSVYGSSAYNIFIGTYLGVTARTIYLWGAQLEDSPYATSLIYTTSSSATRVADACFKTGISSLIGQTEGTIFVDLVYNGSEAQTGNIFSFDQSTSGSVVIIRNSNGSIGSAVWDGSAKAVFNGGSMPIGQRTKIAYAYKSGSTALFVNGVQIGSDSGSTFTLPTISQIYLNSVTAYFAFQQSASFNEAVIFPTRLTNAELAQLTA